MVIGTILLCLLLVYLGVNLYTVCSARGSLFTPEEMKKKTNSAEAILVLGAGVRPNGTPSHMLEDRLLTALTLYQMGVSDRIIVSGDHGEDHYDEVGVMKRYLVAKGVPSEHVFMDHAGFNTYDSLYRAKAVFGAKRVVIVTQRYHAYRSLMIGRSLGLSPVAVAAPIQATEASHYAKQPWYSFRESLARVKDLGQCITKPLPRYLGDPIDLSGSGDVTDG